ncbi:universal stress protein [Steroidobacter agaridevorans]|uniref:universal stress protein n=1 Tax=Steroidobacter agaridevorans TaxID=2695856 RepID=UPI00137A0AF6|nr:universal stress protein [Steroidobacter agaridevorans]
MQIGVPVHETWRRMAVAAGMPRRRILCATDLTPRSDRAMQRAALLAQQMNAEAHFVHALNDRLAGRVLRSKVIRANLRLAAHSQRLMQHAPESVTAEVQLGNPIDIVIATAREYKPDLIVIARPKRRSLDTMLGTAAERIIRGTGCSVLLVGNAAERPYQRMVLATDLSSKSAHVTRTVVGMGMLKNARTWVVHAFGLPYHDIATGDGLDIDGISAEVMWHSTVRRNVLQSLDDAGIDVTRVHIATELSRPLTAIRRVVDQAQPELLVIGVSRWLALKRILVGSVTHRVFRDVNCDVLAIAPPPAERKWLYAA